MLILSACSTQKNTWATRSYHQTKVKYNIAYNGRTSFEEGQKAISNAHTDNFAEILPLYPVSDHRAAESSKSQMDRTIEKCRKSIKLHSIKARPQVDQRRRNNPEYKLWLSQEEFNNQIPQAWIQLGMAEFHKGDFLGAVGTFSYIQNHFKTNKDIIAQCQLWTARAYAEMGWLYEAEDMLRRVQVDDLSRKAAPLYSAATADVLLKMGRYHEALPFVRIAAPSEKRRMYRPRFEYVLAQLYELEGKTGDAVEAYKRVVRMTPGLDMEFSARLQQARLAGASSMKTLERMAKLTKYKDRLDKIYGAMGDIHMQQRDTAAALEAYAKAIELSTQSMPEKGAVLVKAGDLHYGRREYEQAQPYYKEAVTIISAESADYKRVQNRSEVLDELIVQYQMVQLQDSLRRLSKLSEEQQKEVVEKLIADLKEREAAELEKARQAEREARNNGGRQSVNTSNMLGGGGVAGAWYFYNANLIRNGKQEFIKKWGTRRQEDNWRRMSKSVSSMSMEDMSAEDSDSFASAEAGNPAEGEESDGSEKPEAPSTDTHDPRYYLQQIPTTEAALQASDSLIADALYNLIYIYRDRVGDRALSDATFAELRRRFPLDKRVDELDKEYALRERIESDPAFAASLLSRLHAADSLYEQTYVAYKRGDYSAVKRAGREAEKRFADSKLMPRFLFLDAVAKARTEGQPAFVDALQNLVSLYPDTEMGTMGKTMLAMLGQGMESRKGGTSGSLDDLRRGSEEEQVEDELADRVLSHERKGSSYVLLYFQPADEKVLNELLYEVALFNFSQFMIRDFELQQLPVWANGAALRIAGFDGLDETNWYVGLLEQNSELMLRLREYNVTVVQVTEENYKLLSTKYTIPQYLQFFAE